MISGSTVPILSNLSFLMLVGTWYQGRRVRKEVNLEAPYIFFTRGGFGQKWGKCRRGDSPEIMPATGVGTGQARC